MNWRSASIVCFGSLGSVLVAGWLLLRLRLKLEARVWLGLD
jgi:hypothetical protein